MPDRPAAPHTPPAALWDDRAVARADGRLSHDLLPGERLPQDACGVFGVWAPGEEVAKLAYFGLYALQHRGQEAAGIATSDGQRLVVYKDVGLVSQVFDESALASLQGHLAVGHCRYSTTGRNSWENAQPTLGGTADHTVALTHNGNLINTAALRDLLAESHGGDAAVEVARGGVDDDRHLAAGAVELGQHLESVHAGHLEVEEGAVHRLVREQRERSGAVGGHEHLVPREPLEVVRELGGGADGAQ